MRRAWGGVRKVGWASGGLTTAELKAPPWTAMQRELTFDSPVNSVSIRPVPAGGDQLEIFHFEVRWVTGLRRAN
jgi:hypothetical protein